MYDVVDAVNQQIPLEVSSDDMLVLTKFAELPLNPYNPTAIVSIERFKAMTHIVDNRTLKRRLESLEKHGFLVSLEDPSAIGTYSTSCKYKLCLPLGFNEKVVHANRMKVYGGVPYTTTYHEAFSGFEAPKAGSELSPVSKEAANLATTDANLAAENAKITSVKVGRSDILDVLDPTISDVLVDIAEFTEERPVTRVKTKYKHLITTPETAEVAAKTLEKVIDYAEKHPEKVVDKRKYVMTAIRNNINDYKARLSAIEISEKQTVKSADAFEKMVREGQKADKRNAAEAAVRKADVERKVIELRASPKLAALTDEQREEYLAKYARIFSAKWNYADLIAELETKIRSSQEGSDIIAHTEEFYMAHHLA